MPKLLEQPGSFFDWCSHLYKLDEPTAKTQLATLQKILYAVANKMTVTEENAYSSYHIQVIALKALMLSKTVCLKSIMDRMVRIGITYEKSTKQSKISINKSFHIENLTKCQLIALYSNVQSCCNDFLENLQPNLKNTEEMDSYFVLCEYYAFISKKARSYKGASQAYKFMFRPLQNVVKDKNLHSYYYTAFGASAKLALGSIQMDTMVSNDTCKLHA